VRAAARRRGGLSLAAVAFFVFAVSILQTSVAPALPTIQHELGLSTTGLAWALSAYVVVSSVSTPILGRLGDIFGRRRMTIVIAVATLAGCAVAAVAHSLLLLILGRALQGVGGGVFAISFGIVRDELPPARHAAGFGLVSAMWGVGGGAGFPLSGVIVDQLSYRWLFWISAIVVGVAGVAVRALVGEPPLRTRARIDWTGGVLFASGLGAALLAISQGRQWGWGSAAVVGLFAAGAAVLAAWARWELRVDEPLADLRLFARRALWPLNVNAMLAALALWTMFLLVPTFVRTPPAAGYGFGSSATAAGFYLVPLAVLALLGAVVAPRLPPRPALVGGTSVTLAAFAFLAAAHDARWEIMVGSGLCGLGAGLMTASTAYLISLGVPHAQIGEANGMTSMVRAVGGATGATVVGAILAASQGVGAYASAGGYVTAFVVAAVIVAVALLASLLVPAVAGGEAVAGDRAAAAAGAAAR